MKTFAAALFSLFLAPQIGHSKSLTSYDFSSICNRNAVAEQAVQMKQIVAKLQTPETKPEAPKRKARQNNEETISTGKAAVCARYMNADGEFGSKGKVIEQVLTESDDAETYKKYLLSNWAGTRAGMTDVCPRWKSLSQKQRVQFWVWTFAAIAHKESTCGNDPRSQRAARDTATGNLGIGEFQLNYAKRGRSWRGTSLGLTNCRVASVASFSNNAACAIDIMTDQFAGVYSRGQSGQAGLTGVSYWAELKTNLRPSRMQTSPILKNVRKFPGCQ